MDTGGGTGRKGGNMLNKVMLIGRLGRDPELRYTPGGSPVCSLNVATDESYQDRDGNRVDRTEWHRVVVFQRAAENCNVYLHKGSLVFVEGSLQTRKWQDQNGQDRYTTEIKAQRVQFLDKKGDRAPGEEDAYGEQSGYDGGGQRRGPRGGGQSGGQGGGRRQQPPQEEDLGSPFPSEASGMDDVPF